MSFELLPTGSADAAQIAEWIAADPDHRDKPVAEDFFMTGAPGSFLVFKVTDTEGIVFYVRFDPDTDKKVRMHTQFSPGNVSKKRVVMAILGTLPKVIERLKIDFSGIVYESVSPTLIAWMSLNFRFKRVEGTSDYALQF